VRPGKILLIATLTAALITAPAPARAEPSVPAEPLRTLTLITGDRLLVSADGASVSRLPGSGRSDIPLLTRRWQGHLEVLPADAVDLVTGGKLDRRLFDVTTLLELGYDDTRAGLPLLVSYRGAVRRPTAAAVVQELPAIRGLAVEQDRSRGAELWNSLNRPDVAAVRLNGVRKLLLEESTKQVGAPEAWAAGLTGVGVPVGVIDDGVDENHPDLAGKVVARDFTGAGLRDESGHATHVSSTIAGTGAASAGRERGVAPGATVYSAKACTALSGGIGCPDDAIIAAMQWLAAEQHVRVVNMSLGGPDEAGQDAVEEAVERLTAEYGTLFVVAAGNSGIDRPVSSPASAASALAVGAVNADDTLADYSSVGPRLERGVLKPEITAPGTEILAAKAYGRGTDAYQRMSGTSMATPHVAGAAAILAQQHPEWTAAQLKATLMASAAPASKVSVYSQGAGGLDVARAVTQSVTTEPASVNVDDNEPTGQGGTVARTVTYRNAGPRAVTLRLRLAAERRATPPTAAPPAMFTLDRRVVTVPAGGTAAVTIKIDAGTARRAGLYGGELTAAGAGGLAVRTPVGLDRQPQHTLTINHIDRAGQATNRARVVIAGLDNEFLGYATELRTGTVAATLPAGRYLVSSTVMDLNPTRKVTALTNPSVTLDRDLTLDMDARLGKPMSVTLQRPGAVPASAFVNIYARVARGGALGLGIGGISFAEVFSARLGTAPARHVDTKVSGYWSGDNGAWSAAVALNEPHQVLDGYTRVVQDREFATVRSSFAAAATAKSTITKINIPIWPDFGGDDYAAAIETPLPGTRTDYYASSGGATWEVDAYHNVAGALDSLPDVPAYVNHVVQDARAYQAGQTYDESWNKGVFGPAFPAPRPGLSGLTRTGDTLSLSPVVYSDDQGRAGSSTTVGRFLRLTRDGQVLYQGQGQGNYNVPAGEATYEFFVNTGRKPLVGLATQNQVSWTFRSGSTPAETPLPASVLRFHPELDDHNRATTDTIPFEVQRQPGAAPAQATSVAVQLSYDDGKTWTPATVDLAAGVASLERPAGLSAGYVSLQSKVELSDGGVVEQKIIRAYAIK